MRLLKVLTIPALLALAACGADGDPVRPSASVGVGFGSGDADVGAAVGLSSGNVSLGVGF